MAAIFLFGDGGPTIERSVASACSFMEAIYVENGEYEVIYDDSGLVYQPKVEGYRVLLVPTDKRDRGDLVRRLRGYAELHHPTLDPNSPDFPRELAQQDLVSQWDHRWPKRPRWLSRRVHGGGPPDI